jgi:hypothetical protein
VGGGFERGGSQPLRAKCGVKQDGSSDS